ncbi:MarR family transcriptional regulator [Apibacter muscae]|uniref:MarR family winged helix-turn-helix transcriptional regulator n=1 Tax=Apibacter muscae TaxID=2509004 RepID=UPI0011AC5B51|nr:MarR family transcriptional regulator [Apibacter muscae]TWP22751.1 MarR family transcriptional regulator [Apibacter muscae]TWP28213.1 MarR family transcriptional regulator [Apibacter muscae]
MVSVDSSNELSQITENEKTGFLLWKVNNYWLRSFKKRFKDLDITHSQLLLLLSIFWSKTNELNLTQKELSYKSGIDAMTTSTALRTLQKKGLIIRNINNKDTRTHLIEITEKGKTIVEKANDIIKNFNNSFFSCLKDQQKQFQENLINLLLSDENSKQHLLKYYQKELEKFNITVENK